MLTHSHCVWYYLIHSASLKEFLTVKETAILGRMRTYFTSDLQLIKTILAQTVSQSHFLTAEFSDSCREMDRFSFFLFLWVLIVFHLEVVVSWVQAVLELRFNLINVSRCSFMNGCRELYGILLNLHQTSNQDAVSVSLYHH